MFVGSRVPYMQLWINGQCRSHAVLTLMEYKNEIVCLHNVSIVTSATSICLNYCKQKQAK